MPCGKRNTLHGEKTAVVNSAILFSQVLLPLLIAAHAAAAEPLPAGEVKAALSKAVAFFRDEVAVEGGYVWRYSHDLSKREGEGKVGDSTIWVQPPATPSVGEALVDVYELTGQRQYLDAARQSAMALVRGQLHSGGWAARIEFDPAARRRYAYRVDGRPSSKARNVSSLDDDKTQSAARFLMRYDAASKFKDDAIHRAAVAAVNSLLAAQFPNGGWPQGYRGPPDGEFPVKRAAYRDDGQHTRAKAYWDLYTLNDNLISDMIDTLLAAAETYDEDRYRAAALAGGDFLILAQMPEPQPGWAQQYDYEMHPCWARKFEPPAISGGESQRVMTTLMDLYEQTGRRKYLKPIPAALAYYRRSLLPDGRLARFYELKTNRPLYFTKDYQLTYSDKDLPTHYGFIVSSKLERIERRYKSLKAEPWSPPAQQNRPAARPSEESVRRVLDALDSRGAWVEAGRLRYWGKDDSTRRIIDPRTFATNVRILARYLQRK